MSGEPYRGPTWLPYVLPYVLFLALSYLGAEVPGALPYSYPVKALAVTLAVVFFWRAGAYPELDLRPSAAGIAAGVAGFALWLLPEDLLGFLPKIGPADSFDPHASGDGWFLPLVVSRTFTAVLLVPVFEELFLRSFLIRYLDALREDRDDFREIPIGRYRPFSFFGVVVAMAITHHRWLRAGLFSALMCLLLYREKRLGPVIWAHAITNLGLVIHALMTGRWALS